MLELFDFWTAQRDFLAKMSELACLDYNVEI